ncbi:MAG: NAD(P)/FAD-dependent oxidoreductase [Acidimicrobiia bacterium]|nr:NAD(P)/FAD-dependent oxidoreductase [Acidimicrobiia bacterium]
MDFDVIVVGAGYGGATCAALLAEEGLRVCLVDKNPRPGGKAMTIAKDGYRYELWPIAGGPSEGSRVHELAGVLGLEAEIRFSMPEQAGHFRYVRPDGSVVAAPLSARPSADPAAAARLPALLGAGEEESAAMLGAAATILTMPEDQIAALDDVDMLSWLRGFGLAGPLLAHQLTVLNLLFVVPVDRLPASEAIRTLRDFYAGGAGRYHVKGYAHPVEAAVDHLVRKGGEYRSRTRVDGITSVEGGFAVTAGEDELRARAVVSNAGIQPTVLKLVGPEAFPPDYVERVRALEPSLAFVGIRYFVDAPVLGDAMVLQFSDESWWDSERFARAEAGEWPDHPLLFVVVPSLYDPDLAPDPGHQVILAGTMCSPDPQSPMNEAAVERVDREMLWTWPDLEGHVTRREVFTSTNVAAASRDAVVPGQGGECIGLAQVIGQCGRTKPDARSPLPGLYFVGCDAGGYGCGTHQATDSGFNVAALVAGDLARV